MAITKRLLLLFVTMLSVTQGVAQWTNYWKGTGVENDPWLIENLDDWKKFCLMCREDGYHGRYFKLTADLDVGSWLVGMYETSKTTHNGNGCYFDGGGHTITVDYNSTSKDSVGCGLFYEKNGGWIKNLKVVGNISCSGWAGGLVGSVQGGTPVLIENCYVNVGLHIQQALVKNDPAWYEFWEDLELYYATGGIVGISCGNNLTIRGCRVEGSHSRGITYDGIFIGESSVMHGAATIEDCIETGVTSYTDNLRLVGYDSSEAKYNKPTLINTYCRNNAVTDKETDFQYVPFSVRSGNDHVALNWGQEKRHYDVSDITSWEFDIEAALKAAGKTNVEEIPPLPNGIVYEGKHYLSQQCGTAFVKLEAPGFDIQNVTIQPTTATLHKYNDLDSVYIVTPKDSDVVINSDAVTRELDGNGSQNNPYLIRTLDEWEMFCAQVSAGETFLHKFISLENNLSNVTVMAGRTDKPFRGTFLGNNHTLSLALVENQDYVAPFRSIEFATIRDLTITGSIDNASRFTAELAGYAQGDNLIENCVLNAIESSTFTGDATNGGIVANIANGTTTIRNTMFKGSMLGATATHNGGFAGWVNSSVGGKLVVEKSLFAPQELTMGTTNSATFARSYNVNTGLSCRYDAYTRAVFGDKQGYSLYADNEEMPDDVILKRVTALDDHEYWAETQYEVKQVQPRYYYNDGNRIYFGEAVWVNGEIIEPDTDYEIVDRPTTVGEYTMVIECKGDNYRGSLDTGIKFVITTKLQGEGTQSKPYLISSTDDWNSFVYTLNVEKNQKYLNEYVALSADITVTEMAGASEDDCFQGIFDGKGYTLTFNRVISDQSDPDSAYTAPFRYAKNATFKNLQVAGYIKTVQPHAAGIVARSYGKLDFKACRVSTTFNSLVYPYYDMDHAKDEDNPEYGTFGYHGGYLAWMAEGACAEFTDCLFDGTFYTREEVLPYNEYKAMDGGRTERCGGFVGDPGSGSLVFHNCFFNKKYHDQTYRMGAGEFSVQGTDGFSLQLDNCYRGVPFSMSSTTGIQGTYTDKTGEALRQLLGDGWWAYRDKSVLPIMRPFHLEGEGTEASPYIISDEYDWRVFCHSLADGVSYAGDYVKQTGNFETSQMAGSYGHSFCGTYLGDGHTITATLGSQTDSLDIDHAALFQYVAGNVTINRLHVNGTYAQNKNNLSGGTLIGYATGNILVNGCWYDGTVISMGKNSGGLVGFMGYSNSTLTLANCLFNPAGVPEDKEVEAYTLVGLSGLKNVTIGADCYVTDSIGVVQGTVVKKTLAASETGTAVTAADGKTYYIVTGQQGTDPDPDPDPDPAQTNPAVVWCADNQTLYFLGNANLTAGDTFTPPSSTDSPSASPVVATQVWTGTDVTNSGQSVAWGDVKTSCTQVVFDADFADVRPKSCSFWFYNFANMETIDGLPYLNTSDVGGMSHMFSGCKKLQQLDVSHFDTQNVRYMGEMFYNCQSLTDLDVSHFNTGKVEYMFSMFHGCKGLENLDVSNFDTHSAVSASEMFAGCTNLQTLNLSHLNTANVSDMRQMFMSCGNLKVLDLSSFDTRSAKDMSWAFAYCSKLETIIVGDGWNTENLTTEASGNNVFKDCNKLVGGAGTAFSSEHIGKDYAVIDRGANQPGYLTAAISLASNENNGDLLAQYADNKVKATLIGRTLYRDGTWNTLCLPFNTDIAGTPLEGATVKTLSSASFADGTLTLNFSDDLNSIEAGKPYIVRWTDGDNIINPEFTNVTITNVNNPVVIDGLISFNGIYSPLAIAQADNTKLYLGADNNLYWPNAAMTINSFRAYFQLMGLTAADLPNGASGIVLNFGSDETTGIVHAETTEITEQAGAWYTLDGRKLVGKPTQKGVYITRGKKITVK